jgi:hypothetical protein
MSFPYFLSRVVIDLGCRGSSRLVWNAWGSIRLAVWMKLGSVGLFQEDSIFCFYLMILLFSTLFRDMSRAPRSAEKEFVVVLGIRVWMPLLIDRNLLCI